jgi:hypothetical protein
MILSDIHELKARHHVWSNFGLRRVFLRTNKAYGLESLFLVYILLLVVSACSVGLSGW